MSGSAYTIFMKKNYFAEGYFSYVRMSGFTLWESIAMHTKNSICTKPENKLCQSVLGFSLKMSSFARYTKCVAD